MRLMGLLFPQFYHYADISRLGNSMYLILNNTWSMPVQSGIHPQLRTMILLRMCKGLPVEYLSKCGTVCVLRCWTFWTCPAWKPGGKSKVLLTIQHALGEWIQTPQVFLPMSSFNLIVVHIKWEIEIVAAGMNMYLVLLHFRERWFWRVHSLIRFTSHWKVKKIFSILAWRAIDHLDILLEVGP